MTVRAARLLATVYLALFAISVTWPGMVPFNRVHPLILGLPFSMAWIGAWLIASCLVLWLIDAVERRHRDG